MADAGNLVTAAELTEELAANLGLRIAAKRAGQSLWILSFTGRELVDLTIASEQEYLLLVPREGRSFQRAVAEREAEEGFLGCSVAGEGRQYGQHREQANCR